MVVLVSMYIVPFGSGLLNILWGRSDVGGIEAITSVIECIILLCIEAERMIKCLGKD